MRFTVTTWGRSPKRMRTRYPIALIDEFQDTDRLQARIFEAIYPIDGLIVVGDPKQSIYRFRGADVYAYVDARRRFDECTSATAAHAELPLDTPPCGRGERRLPTRQPLSSWTRSASSRPSPPAASGALTVEDQEFDHKPFQLHLFGLREDGKAWTKPALTDLAAAHAANRIAALLRMGGAGKAVLAEGPMARTVGCRRRRRAGAHRGPGPGDDPGTPRPWPTHRRDWYLRAFSTAKRP